MTTATGSSTIRALASATPELAVLAAVVERAVLDAKSGDTEAQTWLHSPDCRWYLDRIAPDGMDTNVLQSEIVALACLN